MEEEAEEAKAAMNPEASLPAVNPNAELLQPAPPIQQMEDNWPLLTVSKGFFEGIKAVRDTGGRGPGIGSGPVKGAGGALAMDADLDDDQAGGAWGDDDDLGLDDEDGGGDEFKSAGEEDDGEGGGKVLF